MILQGLGILAFGIGVGGLVYFLIKNGRELRKNLEEEIEETRK